MISNFVPFLPCSLGLVLPSYSENHIRANLSDQILQVQCKYQRLANTQPAHLSFFPKRLPLSCPLSSNQRRAPPLFPDITAAPGPSVDSRPSASRFPRQHRESESGRVLLWNPTPPLPSSLLSSYCSVLRWFFFPCTDEKKKPSQKPERWKLWFYCVYWVENNGDHMLLFFLLPKH